jgi:hypothetical protein
LWQRLARPPAAAADDSASHSAYSRETLQAMIERKRQNDFVRKREFDQLRKLRKRVLDGVPGGGDQPSFFQTSWRPGFELHAQSQAAGSQDFLDFVE